MEPLPWLNFQPMQTPQLPARPSFGEQLGQLGVAAIKSRQQRGRGINPKVPKFRKPQERETDQMGPAPPVIKRKFPNQQQQQQLDAMRMD